MSRVSENIFEKNLKEISGFDDIPEGWEAHLIQDIFDIGRGRVISQNEINEHPGSYPVYSSQSFNYGVMGTIDTFDFEGEYLTWTTDGAYAGTVFHRIGKFSCTNVCGTLKADEKKVFTKFFHYHLGKISKRYVSYVGNPKLMNDIMANIAITVPPLPTQRKISHILSTADAVIEKTQATIAKYKAIKQGMLHDLFTRGIDMSSTSLAIYGKLRPRYEDAPGLYKESSLGFTPVEWEVIKIADVSENLDGKRIPVKQENRDKQAEIYPYYGASGIIDYVEDYIFDEPLILLGEDGENVVSRNLPLAFKVEGKIWVNNHAHVLRPISGITTIEFLCEVLESIDYSPIVSGSAQPKITQGHLSKILVRIPKIEEQIKISERIVSINKILHTEQTYLHKLQQLKAGLMSDLLSGRVKVSESQMEGIKG